MYAKLSRSAARRGQLDKVTPHRGDSHSYEIALLEDTHTRARARIHTRVQKGFFFPLLLLVAFQPCSFHQINVLFCIHSTADQHT